MAWLQRSADKGYVWGQHLLGVRYDEQGDYANAVKWERKAAEQGFANAQCGLGTFYYTGDGVKQDYAEAIKWFTMAAEKGEPTAQYNLSLFYIEGFGVEPDTVQAQKWYDLAKKQRNDLPPLIIERPVTNDIVFNLPSSKKKGKKGEKLTSKDQVKYARQL
jgi:TPR repeat protein